MQVARRPLGVARDTDVAKHGAGRDDLALAYIAVAAQMRVIVPVAAGTQHAHDLAPKTVRPDRENDTFRRAEDWCPAGREYVDALMAPVSAPRGAPRVRELALLHAFDGDRVR
jgi:hypothetical protein